MGFKTDGVAIADFVECAELGCPVNEAGADGRPFNFAVGAFDCVLYVAMMDAILGQCFPCRGEGIEFAAHDGVGWIPVEGQVRRLDGIKRARCFAAGGSVALELVFEDQQDALFAGGLCGGAELVVNGGAVRSHIVEAPEVEAADFVGAELFGQAMERSSNSS